MNPMIQDPDHETHRDPVYKASYSQTTASSNHFGTREHGLTDYDGQYGIQLVRQGCLVLQEVPDSHVLQNHLVLPVHLLHHWFLVHHGGP